MSDVETRTSPAPSVLASLWRSVQPTGDEIRAARRRLHMKAVAILSLVVASYWALVVSDVVLPLRLGAAAVLVVALIAVGTSIMHDANHGSFSRHKWLNRGLAYTSDALGASSWLWRFQHNNLHHGNTNVPGFDADISLAPLGRLEPTQPWRPWYRAQHVYLWPLYGFMALKNLLVSDIAALAARRIGDQSFKQPLRRRVVARVVAGKFAHLSWAVVIPLMFNPWWTVLVFYLAVSWLVGFSLAVIFQLAHCVDVTTMAESDTPRRGDDYVAHQMRTSADIASPTPVAGHFFRWLFGGLDHQIEHHLAPRLPHTVYPSVARRFRQVCSEHGVDYHLHTGVWAAVRSHARWLRLMSIRPAASTA